MEKITKILWKITNLNKFIVFQSENEVFYYLKSKNQLFVKAKLNFFVDNIVKMNISSDVFFVKFDLFYKLPFFSNWLKEKKITTNEESFWVLKITPENYIFDNNLIKLSDKYSKNDIFCYNITNISFIKFVSKNHQINFFENIQKIKKKKFYYFCYHLGINNFFAEFKLNLNFEKKLTFLKSNGIFSFFHKYQNKKLICSFFNNNFKDYYLVQKFCNYFNFLEDLFTIYELIFYNHLSLEKFFGSSYKKGYIYYFSNKEIEDIILSISNFWKNKNNIVDKKLSFDFSQFETNFFNLSNYLINFKSMQTFGYLKLLNPQVLTINNNYFESSSIIIFLYLYFWTKTNLKYDVIKNIFDFSLNNKTFLLLKNLLFQISLSTDFKENLTVWYFWSKSIRNLIVHFEEFSTMLKDYSYFCQNALNKFKDFYKNSKNKNVALVIEFWKKIIRRDNFWKILKDIPDIFFFQIYIILIFSWILICKEANITFDIYILLDWEKLLYHINNNEQEATFKLFYKKCF